MSHVQISHVTRTYNSPKAVSPASHVMAPRMWLDNVTHINKWLNTAWWVSTCVSSCHTRDSIMSHMNTHIWRLVMPFWVTCLCVYYMCNMTSLRVCVSSCHTYDATMSHMNTHIYTQPTQNTPRVSLLVMPCPIHDSITSRINTHVNNSFKTSSKVSSCVTHTNKSCHK